MSKRDWVPPPATNFPEYKRGEPMWSVKPEGIPIRKSQTGMASKDYGIMHDYFRRAAQQFPDHPALKVEKAGYPADRVGEWQVWTWKEWYDESFALGKSLLAVGLKPFMGVPICGFAHPCWYIAFFGSILAGGLPAGTYQTNSPDACAYIANHSEALVVFVDTLAALKKYVAVKSKLTTVKHVVVWREAIPDEMRDGEFVLSWEEFLAKGKDVPDSAMEERRAFTKPQHCANIVYTSGTTGPPKAVMLSHDNWLFQHHQVTPHVGFPPRPEHHVCVYLPLSHVAAEFTELFAALFVVNERNEKATVSFARPDALKGSLSITLKAVRPTTFLGVPRVYEKIVEGIKAQAKKNPAGWLKSKIVNFARNKGLQDCRNRQVGGSGTSPWGIGLARRLVHNKVRTALGFDRCQEFLVGAAPSSPEMQDFLASLGIDLFEQFGMSETAACGVSSGHNRFLYGSCGSLLQHSEVKIDHNPSRDKPNEGEILMRGRHIMIGYLKDEAKTKEIFDDDGWLHTGDIGRIEGGMLFITGRIKELIITAGGENIAPVPIEEAIKRLCPALSNVVMIGNRRKYNAALIGLKQKPNLDTGEFHDELIGEAQEVNPEVKTVTAALSDPKWQEYIQKGIEAYNRGPSCVSNAQKVQKFRILPCDLSIPGGELTATMKVKRSVIEEKYANLIHSMYEE